MSGAQPFLKWVGGKRQLLPVLVDAVRRLGPFGAYHEPFVGGGALFFALRDLGLARGDILLSDVNIRLIEAYQGVASSLEAVLEHLRRHRKAHSSDHYYAVRAKLPRDLPARAARIVYLNRTCFNGLYRENASGGFNVPMGRYANPDICNEERLTASSRALEGVSIDCRPFETVLERARPGDLVYFDPPYVPASDTAYFTAYARDGFSMDDQARLASVFATLAQRGVHAMLSNSRTDAILELYEGFRIETVMAARAVNCRADRRGKVEEVLVTSF